jgi:hypothetical protein
MSDEPVVVRSPDAQRLCSEIQLFDLCDLDSCRFKQSRFCTNEELLAKFESIKDDNEQNALVYEDEDINDDAESESESDYDDFDDSFDADDEIS